jgi:predicted CopG family antitoxin
MQNIRISDDAYDNIVKIKGDLTVDEYVSRIMENICLLSSRLEELESKSKKMMTSLHELDIVVNILQMETALPEKITDVCNCSSCAIDDNNAPKKHKKVKT